MFLFNFKETRDVSRKMANQDVDYRVVGQLALSKSENEETWSIEEPEKRNPRLGDPLIYFNSIRSFRMCCAWFSNMLAKIGDNI